MFRSNPRLHLLFRKYRTSPLTFSTWHFSSSASASSSSSSSSSFTFSSHASATVMNYSMGISGKGLVNTTSSASAVGPYSQAILAPSNSRLLFVSGQLGLDPTTLQFDTAQSLLQYLKATPPPCDASTLFRPPPVTSEQISSPVAAQTYRALLNLGHILSAAGVGFPHVLKTTVLLADIADFAAVNEVYALFFPPLQNPQVAAGTTGGSATATAASNGGGTDPTPARMCFAVKALPKAALVEIEAVAAVRA